MIKFEYTNTNEFGEITRSLIQTPGCNSIEDIIGEFTKFLKSIGFSNDIMQEYYRQEAMCLQVDLCNEYESLLNEGKISKESEDTIIKPDCQHKNTKRIHPYGWIVCVDCDKLLD